MTHSIILFRPHSFIPSPFYLVSRILQSSPLSGFSFACTHVLFQVAILWGFISNFIGLWLLLFMYSHMYYKFHGCLVSLLYVHMCNSMRFYFKLHRFMGSPFYVLSCASPDTVSVKRPCRKSHRRMASPSYALSHAWLDYFSVRMPCCRSHSCGASPLYVLYCALLDGFSQRRVCCRSHSCMASPLYGLSYGLLN